MNRRDFLAGTAIAGSVPFLGLGKSDAHEGHERTFATPQDAMNSPAETLAYVSCVHASTKNKGTDFLATIDLDPSSSTYSQITNRLPMPTAGDELHHFGWNACASCHGMRDRRYLIIPGLVSGRIHVVDTQNPGEPKIVKVIEPDEVVRKTKLTAPHTVHCLSDGSIMISMLGDEKLQGPGGFLLLDEKFNVAGRWEADTKGMNFNYDFWYQPRHNVMVSSEWGAPATTRPGFKLEDVQAGKYGHHVHIWDWNDRRILQSIDLGEQGMIPLEIRFHHNPESAHGYVGAALSSVMWHLYLDGKTWKAEKVIEVPGVDQKGWPFPVPGLISDLVVSMDDRWLYFSNWLQGDVRQYDISDPHHPKLAGQVYVGGVIGKAPPLRDTKSRGGPQMLQLSLDGKRLYVTDSLFSSWDNQFYPQIASSGSLMLQLDVDNQHGGLKLNDRFLVDFGQEKSGPVRAHEMRFPLGDCTSDIWM